MLLWTTLNTSAYKAFKRNKILKGDWRRADHRDFLPAYKWMAEQMVERGIMSKPTSFLWAWHTYGDKKKPDYRDSSFKSQLKYNKTLYRATMEIPAERVLLSDYDLWHNVLCGFYTSINEREWDRIYPESLIGKKKRSWINCGTTTEEEVKESWKRIFNLDIAKDPQWDPEWMGSDSGDYIYIQACTPCFKWEWVNKIEKFRHKCKMVNIKV